MRRVDAHVHVFPDRLAEAVRGHLGRVGTLDGGFLLADVARQVRAAGFDAAWALPYAHRPGVAEGVNEWSAREVREHAPLVPGATFHPGDDIGRLAERALLELRLSVVKLHCAVGAFSPGDQRLNPLWRVAEATGVPVVVHAGQRSPGDTEADEIRELAPVLASHPRLRVVLAHAGHPATPAALDLMAVHPNLYADLTPVWDRPVQVSAAALARFRGRFLFGSDAPNNPVPPAEQARRVEAMGLEEADLKLVLGGAAEALQASPHPENQAPAVGSSQEAAE